MKYIGTLPQSQIPENAVSTQYVRTGKHKGAKVDYYDVWVPDQNVLRPTFVEGSEPDKATISRLTKLFRLFAE